MQIIPPRPTDLGGGLEVRRALPHALRRSVGPFVFLDEFGPTRFEAGHGMEVRPHPHIGLATVTYLLDGEVEHRDSLGTHLTIRPGEVNWMTAGRGIVHSERSPAAARAAGASLWGLQFWVALPLELEGCEPTFAHTDAAALPQGRRGGARWRLVLGEAFGARSPVEVPSPMLLVDVELDAHERFELGQTAEEHALYLLDGELQRAGGDIAVERGQLLVLEPGETVLLESGAEPARFVVLGGPPLGVPRVIWWNFVASTTERVLDAQAAWSAQDPAWFPPVPGETDYIPLPSRPGPPRQPPL